MDEEVSPQLDRAFESTLDEASGKVGFVTIIGRPNVGKSTFLNKVLRYHLTAVSTRPNTTRKKWLGILSDERSQIIFADTPGVHESRNKMHEAMARTIETCIDENDMVLCICDASREFGDEDRTVAEIVAKANKPVILAINKVDAATKGQIRDMRKAYSDIIGESGVFEISSLVGTRTDDLLDAIRAQLPEGPFLFPSDQLADVIERDIAEEIIREAANELLYQEIPQSLTVKIDTWNENEKKIKIAATLFVERKPQKLIVIGEKGSMVSSIIKSAREKLRVDLDKFIDVKLNVKVAPDWQNKKSFLRDYGIVDTKKS
ncbi:GTPase Era [Puniceicoccaceae bacterium K14]|nr:GTPase Era [Puniceicoccaceae bacterium K14]